MNPCPCGYAGDPGGRCRCTPDAIARYRARLSGPLLDRIDLKLDVPRVPHAELRDSAAGESSATVRARVVAARARQLDRAVERLGLSARAYHRVLRVARTIADLAGVARIDAAHLSEAIQYRRA